MNGGYASHSLNVISDSGAAEGRAAAAVRRDAQIVCCGCWALQVHV
jgi:hypothetical protein